MIGNRSRPPLLEQFIRIQPEQGSCLVVEPVFQLRAAQLCDR